MIKERVDEEVSGQQEEVEAKEKGDAYIKLSDFAELALRPRMQLLDSPQPLDDPVATVLAGASDELLHLVPSATTLQNVSEILSSLSAAFVMQLKPLLAFAQINSSFQESFPSIKWPALVIDIFNDAIKVRKWSISDTYYLTCFKHNFMLRQLDMLTHTTKDLICFFLTDWHWFASSPTNKT